MRSFGNIWVPEDTYQAARLDRLNKWGTPPSMSADMSIDPHLEHLHGLSSDQKRNGGFARAILETMLNGIVGNGLKPMSSPMSDLLGLSEIQAEKTAHQMDDYFELWANGDVDVSDSQNFFQYQRSFVESVLEFGDCISLFRFDQSGGIKLQSFEGRRIATPDHLKDKKNIFKGIKFHPKSKKHLSYFLKNEDYQEENFFEVPKEINGKSVVLFQTLKNRLDQTRGVPLLSHIATELKELLRYTSSEVEAAVLNSFISFVTTTSDGYNPLSNDGMERSTNEKKRYIPEKIRPHTNIHLRENESVTVLDSKRPNSNFESFFNIIGRISSSSLCLPFGLAMSKFDKSYSANKADIAVGDKTFQVYRSGFESSFYNPIWSRVIEKGVLDGHIQAPGFFENDMKKQAYLNCSWVGSSTIHLDLEKNAKAYEKLIESGIISKRYAILQVTGQNYRQVQRQIQKEKKEISEEAKVANRQKTNGNSKNRKAEANDADG